jgi:hypothetical protein
MRDQEPLAVLVFTADRFTPRAIFAATVAPKGERLKDLHRIAAQESHTEYRNSVALGEPMARHYDERNEQRLIDRRRTAGNPRRDIVGSNPKRLSKRLLAAECLDGTLNSARLDGALNGAG